MLKTSSQGPLEQFQPN